MQRNGIYLNRHAEATKHLQALDHQKKERIGRSKTIALFIQKLESRELDALTEFDDDLWATTIDRVIVAVDGKLTFRFKNGQEISV